MVVIGFDFEWVSCLVLISVCSGLVFGFACFGLWFGWIIMVCNSGADLVLDWYKMGFLWIWQFWKFSGFLELLVVFILCCLHDLVSWLFGLWFKFLVNCGRLMCRLF